MPASILDRSTTCIGFGLRYNHGQHLCSTSIALYNKAERRSFKQPDPAGFDTALGGLFVLLLPHIRAFKQCTITFSLKKSLPYRDSFTLL